MEYFRKGRRGIIHKDKNTVVKSKNPKADTERIGIEAGFLKKLNKYGIGPRYKFFKEGKLGMEFIDGELFEEYIAKNSKKKIIKVIRELFRQLHTMDRLGINKEEMHHPVKHIIIRKDEPYLIDFERCRYTEKPKNVSQFIQYITGKRISEILKQKGIKINREEMLRLSGEYKKNLSQDVLDEMISAF